MNTIPEQPVTVTELLSAYFVSGMHCHDVRNVLDKWDRGDIELVHELLTYAAPLAHMMTAGILCAGNNGKGVFLYEVAEPFGSWFAEVVARTGSAPQREQAHARLHESVVDYFSKSEGCDVAKLILAVGSAHGLVSIH